ncbi:MAG: hypothetical protein JO281_06475 [Pseudonocardiales bacterium]|nr:hypothetical protein [Pseudonocardiales bacterium]
MGGFQQIPQSAGAALDGAVTTVLWGVGHQRPRPVRRADLGGEVVVVQVGLPGVQAGQDSLHDETPGA